MKFFDRLEYKETIKEMIEEEYGDTEDLEGEELKEYKNIMKNLNKITKNVYKQLYDYMDTEEELNIIWNEIDKYKEEK